MRPAHRQGSTPSNADLATRQDLEVLGAKLNASHAKWTFAVVIAVNGLFSGLTVGPRQERSPQVADRAFPQG